MKNLVLFIALLSFTFGFSQEKKKQVVEAALRTMSVQNERQKRL